jgi:hypothetical protein
MASGRLAKRIGAPKDLLDPMKRADFPRTSVLAARSAVGEREQGDVAGSLDRDRHGPLVPRAGAELSSWLDLAALANVAAEAGNVLVIDVVDVVGAELADLATAREAATAASTATATAAGSATLAALTLALGATEAGAGPPALAALAGVPGVRPGIVCRVVSISHWSGSRFSGVVSFR